MNPRQHRQYPKNKHKIHFPFNEFSKTKKRRNHKNKTIHEIKERRISKIALFISIGAAVFAFWQGCVARDTETRQLRAYVILKGITIVKPTIGSTYIGAITYENGGVTPAYNCRHWIRAYLDTVEITREKIESLVFDPIKGFALGSNTPITQNSYWLHAFNKEACDYVSTGYVKIYIFGSIFYDDIFHIPHFTHFCGSYDPNTGTTTARTEYSDAN
jgi:hypothetical protein